MAPKLFFEAYRQTAPQTSLLPIHLYNVLSSIGAFPLVVFPAYYRTRYFEIRLPNEFQVYYFLGIDQIIHLGVWKHHAAQLPPIHMFLALLFPLLAVRKNPILPALLFHLAMAFPHDLSPFVHLPC